MLGSFAGCCCARVVSGHAAAPPRTPTKSRRLMPHPALGDAIVAVQTITLIGPEKRIWRTKLGGWCRPFRVNRVTLSVRRSLPVYPRKRTSTDRPVWSVSCQQETHAPQQFNRLLDHLVGAGEQRW